MATINITDLKPIGTDLFMDSESFMNNLTDDELAGTQGGGVLLNLLLSSSGACAITIATVSLVYVTYEVYQAYQN